MAGPSLSPFDPWCTSFVSGAPTRVAGRRPSSGTREKHVLKLKSVLTVIGAVTILVLAGNTVAFAATGHSFILGKVNKANLPTTLKRTTNGPALNLITKPLSSAPFAVNTTGKVTNLNAD